MENSLYQEKVGILSRLIKESSLTLEEALLLLKEEEIQEEEEEVVAPTIYPGGITTYPSTNPFTVQPYGYGYTTTIGSASVGSNISSSSITYANTPDGTQTSFNNSSFLSTSNEQVDLNS